MEKYTDQARMGEAKINAHRYVVVLNKSDLDKKTKIVLFKKFINKLKENNCEYLTKENMLVDKKYINEVWDKVSIELEQKLI